MSADVNFHRGAAITWSSWYRALALLLMCCGVMGRAVCQVRADAAPAPNWGAIASIQGWHGYAYDLPTRAAAELSALAQCDKAAGRSRCVVRVAFDRACGALATGNYGEWGAASAATPAAASDSAIGQCNAHLPAEPCKVVVNVCSAR